MEVKIVNDLSLAKEIWEAISPQQSLYDLWEFRFVFYKYFNYELYFVCLVDENKYVGLLPLQFNTHYGHLEFFGGTFMEDNHSFVKKGYENYIGLLYDNVKRKALLEDMIVDNLYCNEIKLQEYKYFTALGGLTNIEDFINRNFQGKSRNTVKRKLKSVENNYHPDIVINRCGDITQLFELNRKTFKEDSSFNFPFREDIFKELVDLDFDLHLLSFYIGEKLEAISFSINFNNTYFYINSGTNKFEYPNLGTYLVLKNIEQAINVETKFFDAGVGDLGWKESWHLDRVAQYKFSIS